MQDLSANSMDNLSMQLPTVLNSVDGAEKCCPLVLVCLPPDIFLVVVVCRKHETAQLSKPEWTKSRGQFTLRFWGKGLGVQKPTIPSEPLPLPRSACL